MTFSKHSSSQLIRKVPVGVVVISDKIIQREHIDGCYYVTFINATDATVRIQLAAESEKERDEWYDSLAVACENIKK